GHDDRDVFRRGLTAASHTVRIWPVLRAVVGLDDPSPALARSLWALAGVLTERVPVREAHRKLTEATRTVPADSPVHLELTSRLAQVESTRRRLDARIRRHLADLTTLAGEVDRFVAEQQALAEARAVV